MSLVLAGRIGGTKTKLAIFNYKNGNFERLAYERYDTKKFKNCYAIIKSFLKTIDLAPRAACFAAAGPCADNICKMTNLPWSIDAAKINKLFGIKKVTVINDYEGIAFGIEVLKKKDLKMIKPGKHVKLNRKAVIGASTGLGKAIVTWIGNDEFVIPSEGGHVDFAARNDLEWELKKFIKRKKGRIDVESLVSKEGLYNIYNFLIATKRFKESAKTKQLLKKKEKHIAILEAAKFDPACKKALDMFTSFYASEAGNMALNIKATGGVFLVGSLSRRLAPKLKSAIFKKSFEDKSKMKPLLKKIPVFVVMREEVELLGAANLASKL